MTKKLEDFFNLPPAVTVENDIPAVRPRDELVIDTREMSSQITTAEKVDYALKTVSGLDIHDSEMDDISKKALDTFSDLISLGNNVPDVHAGKIYEVAGQMLKTAMDARNSKADKKLKMIELQLKKVRAEQIDFELGTGPVKGAQGGEFDRNELMKYIVNSQKSGNSDNSDK